MFPNLPGRARAGGSLLQALAEIRFTAERPDLGHSAYQMALLKVTTTFPEEEVQALTAKEIHTYLLKPLTDSRQNDALYSMLCNDVKGDGNCNNVEFLALA